MDKLEKRMKFLIEIDKLKEIYRQSLISDSSRHENDAEHSWHISIMAVVLYDYAPENVDLLKCIKMLLIHDIIEIYAGDTYVYDYTKMKDKKEREMEAAKKIYNILDDKMAKELYDLWIEFEECKTNESIYANTLDRIEPIILNYLTKGEMWKKNKITKEQVVSTRLNLIINGNEKIRQYILSIIDESVKKGYLIE